MKFLFVGTMLYQGFYLYTQIQANPGPYFSSDHNVFASRSSEAESESTEAPAAPLSGTDVEDTQALPSGATATSRD